MTRRVLVTRPRPEADETAMRLEDMGFSALVLPLTRIVALPVALEDVGGPFDAVALTSANAARHAPPELVACLADLPCFAVGDRTAAATRAAGLREVQSAGGDVGDLVRAMKAALPPGARIAYPCGRVRRRDLERDLAASGHPVVPVETYDTVSVSPSDADIADLVRRPVDVVLVHSQRAAAELRDLLARPEMAKALDRARFACLSGRIAAALGVPAPRLLVADRPEQEALLAVLRDAR